MKNLTVYQQMTASSAQLIKTVSTEIGVKCCQPFAVRAFDALNELQLKTETEAKKAANVFLDNLQTLVQGGIISEDYDKLDLVKRGNVITISARVQALIRAFKRKGFTVIDTVVAVPNGEDIYFEEDYRDGNIIYLLKDKRLTTDREITAERLVSNYFNKFLCRLEIRNLKDNQVIMTVTEMSNSEIMNAQSSSDKGIFLSEWKGVVDKNGNPVYADKAKTRQKKVKVFYDGTGGREKRLDTESLWVKWTSEMVRKTIIRRALKNIKEAIPELAPTIIAFDTEYNIGETENTPTQENIIDVVGIDENVDLTNLTEEQQQDVSEVYDIYVANPASAKEDAERLKALYETGKPTNEIINENYAELVNLSKSKNLYPLIENIIKGVAYEKVKN